MTLDINLSTIVQTLAGLGIASLIGLVLRLDKRVALQNGSVADVVREFAEHKRNDREDFQRVFDKLDERRA